MLTNKLSRSQRYADAVTEFCGSWTFIGIGSALTAGWIGVNTFWLIWGTFDPSPFILFNLVLTVVSTFQSPLIMMSQNRSVERDRAVVQELHEKLDELKRVTLSELATGEIGCVFCHRGIQSNRHLVQITDNDKDSLICNKCLPIFQSFAEMPTGGYIASLPGGQA